MRPLRPFVRLRLRLLALLLCLPSSFALGQPQETYIQVTVTPDHPDWRYRVGETARFHVSVLRHGHPVEGAAVRYEVGPELMPPRASGPLPMQQGRTTLDGGTMQEPGFLRCRVFAEVGGKTYSGLATAAFEPERIAPTTTVPADFTTFWEEALAQAAQVPFDERMTLVPERSTDDFSVYHVSFQNDRPGSRIYGILTVPTAPGRYPALLKVPGAGVRPYFGDLEAAARGVITLEVGIHGLPVNLPQAVYDDLRSSGLRDYPMSDLDDRDRYYYKRVYVGMARAADFLAGLPQFDGENLAVYGGSQGGALAIVTAALNPRIRLLAATYPALSDLTGYLHGRAGGWPHLFAPANLAFNNTPDRIETSKYYDVVNFARRLRVPGFYTWGFNDVTCPPTSMYAAYNVIEAPKELFVVQETGHWTYPEQRERTLSWLLERLKK